jgi:hypothetical protein
LCNLLRNENDQKKVENCVFWCAAGAKKWHRYCMAAQGNPVMNPVRADRRTTSVLSLCEKHGVACGLPGSMVAFMRAIHENKLLAMEFWRIVGDITDEECGSGSVETVNQVILGVIAKSVTDLDVAGVMAAGRGPGGALIELASMLAGEDVGSPLVAAEAPPPVEAIESRADVYSKGSGKDSDNESGKESWGSFGLRTPKPVKVIKTAGDGAHPKYSKLVQYETDDVVESFDKYSRRFNDAGEVVDDRPRIKARSVEARNVDARNVDARNVDARNAWTGNGGEMPVESDTSSKYAEFLKSDVAKDTAGHLNYPVIPASLWQYKETFRERLRVEREESWQAILDRFTVVTPLAIPAVVKAVVARPDVPMETGWIPKRISTWILVILMLSTGMVSGMLLARYGSTYWREFDYWMIRHKMSMHAYTPNTVGDRDGSMVASTQNYGEGLRIRLI